MPGPQRKTQEEYLAGIEGGSEVIQDAITDVRSPTGRPFNYGGIGPINVGNDMGRGPGTPGGRGTGNAGRTFGPVGHADLYTELDLDRILRGMPPERIAEMQYKMREVGLLPQNYRSFGFVENTMRSGFAELLEVSNARGFSYVSTLDQLVSDTAVMGGGAGGEDTFAALQEARRDVARQRANLIAGFDTRLNTYESSDPASIRQTAEQAFQQALGRKPKDEELAKFTSAFLGRERTEQSNVFGVQDRLERAARDRAVGTFDANAQATLTAAGTPEGGSEADVLWSRLQRMIADAPGRITPGSRSRDYATQVRLWNNYKAGRGPQAARPGTSKHGDGRANDLTYENDAVRRWALANAGKYGLAFPIYDPKKPRSLDESWHIEVAGGSKQFRAQGGHAGHSHGDELPMPGEAPISADVTVQRQDAGAQALEFAEQENPVEKAAYDIGGQFNNLLAILNRSLV